MFNFLRGRGALLATIVLFVQAGVYYSMSRTEVIPDTPPWSQFPTTVGNWTTVTEAQMDPAIIAVLQPDDYITRNYTSSQESGHPVKSEASNVDMGLFIGYFKTQRKGLAPHSPKACLPGAGWEPVSSEVRDLGITGESVPVNYTTWKKQNLQFLVLYWYQQDRRAFANEYLAQIYAVPELFLHGRTDIAIVRVITPIPDGGLSETTRAAMGFGRQIYPLIRQHIPAS